MISFPKGCGPTYNFWIDIDKLTDEIIDWYKSIGGDIREDTYFNRKGQKVIRKFVKLGKNKWCHYHSDGLFGIRLHFDQKDANIASLFLLKYNDIVLRHNILETTERKQKNEN